MVVKYSKFYNDFRTNKFTSFDPVKSEYLELIARLRRLSACSSRISALILNHLQGKDSGEPVGRSSKGDSSEDPGKPTGLVGRSSKRVKISPEMLVRKWQISLKKAEQTLKVTTQKGTRKHGDKLVWRLGTQRWRNKRIVPG